MANWNLYNASGASFGDDNNVGPNTGVDGYIEWEDKAVSDFIIYQQSPNLQLLPVQEYQLEFYYNCDPGVDVDLKINIYGDWDGTIGVAPGIEFNLTLSDTSGSDVLYSAIVESGSDGAPPGTTDQDLANKMVIKYDGVVANNSVVRFDNFTLKKVLGYSTTIPETLPNWDFLNPINFPGFVPGVGALDFTTYADQVWFPQGPDVYGNVSAYLVQYATILDPGQTYRLTMDINNDLATNMNGGGGPAMPSYNGGLYVNSVNAQYEGTVVNRVPITEDNNIGTAEWRQTSVNQWLVIGMEPGGEALVDNIVLKVIHQTSGAVTNWDLIDGGEAMELYWNPDDLGSTQGGVVFDTTNGGLEMNQVIDGANTFAGDEFRITFNVSDYSAGEINGYLYNDEGKGFVFGPISSNGFHTFNHVVSQSTLASSNINNVSRLGLVSGTSGFGGRIDNMSLETLGGGKTLSFGEDIKGWSSFKSFIPDLALSVSGQYYTTNRGQLYKHHQEFEVDGVTPISRNNFYGDDFESSITPIFNAQPEMVKNFNTLNYEGSQSKVDVRHDDENYHNLIAKDGWYVSDIHTDKQEGSLNEFIEKEGKWFNYIKGLSYQVDTSAFNFQGVGIVETVADPDNFVNLISITPTDNLVEGDATSTNVGVARVTLEIPPNWFISFNWVSPSGQVFDGTTQNTGSEIETIGYNNAIDGTWVFGASVGAINGVWTASIGPVNVIVGLSTNLPDNTMAIDWRQNIIYNITSDFQDFSFENSPTTVSSTGLLDIDTSTYNFTTSASYTGNIYKVVGDPVTSNDFIPAGIGKLLRLAGQQLVNIQEFADFDSINVVDTSGNLLTVNSHTLI